MNRKKNILIAGAGPAGLEAAYRLSMMGFSPILVEKEEMPGGHLNKWDRLFPEREAADEILERLLSRVKNDVNIKIFTSSYIEQINELNDSYNVILSTGVTIIAEAVLITTGFDLFNASRKEEYGYGIYERVITNADLESWFKGNGKIPVENPQSIGFVHCVGSRDEKAGNRHCSKVCCVTAVKQAIEIKEIFPHATVYCFYMDLRMFGRHYEDMYLEAQQKHGIRFIRGRVSEVSENKEGRLVVKAEDTLAGKPVKATMDLLVLMAGMTRPASSASLYEQLDLSMDEDGFLRQSDAILNGQSNHRKGIFVAGACTGPKTLPDTIHEADSAAMAIYEYLNRMTV